MDLLSSFATDSEEETAARYCADVDIHDAGRCAAAVSRDRPDVPDVDSHDRPAGVKLHHQRPGSCWAFS